MGQKFGERSPGPSHLVEVKHWLVKRHLMAWLGGVSTVTHMADSERELMWAADGGSFRWPFWHEGLKVIERLT